LVVVDIDEVLGDYVTGICRWVREYGPSLLKLGNVATARLIGRLEEVQRSRGWVGAEVLDLSYPDWQKVKHDFRTRGGKRTLPVFTDAKPFLEWCHARNWIIILVTSRPIAEYPNIFTDTLLWLDQHALPFDHVWWATEKAERLEDADIALRSKIRFAVDDLERYVNQFASKGVKSYQLVRGNGTVSSLAVLPNVHIVRTLTEIMEQENQQ
jgi:hypothetical protein